MPTPPIPCDCTLPADTIIAITAVIIGLPTGTDIGTIAATANCRISEVLTVFRHMEKGHDLSLNDATRQADEPPGPPSSSDMRIASEPTDAPRSDADILLDAASSDDARPRSP